MADGRHNENHFLAITWLVASYCPIKTIFGVWRLIFARIQRFGDENVKFRKSNMADGRHFENRYSTISQLRIVRI